MGKQGKVTVWDCHSEVTTALLAANTSFSEVVNISSVDIIAKSEALSTLLKDEKQCWFAQTRVQKHVHKGSQMFNSERKQPLTIVHCDKNVIQ